jgi:hypothetical protein
VQDSLLARNEKQFQCGRTSQPIMLQSCSYQFFLWSC